MSGSKTDEFKNEDERRSRLSGSKMVDIKSKRENRNRVSASKMDDFEKNAPTYNIRLPILRSSYTVKINH